MAYEEHIRSARDLSARCAVITLSDTRHESNDKSGARIKELLAGDGHAVADYRVIPDDPQRLDESLTSLFGNPEIDAILTNGGTGMSRRDQTIGVIERRLEQTLPGFGELFRSLSYEQ